MSFPINEKGSWITEDPKHIFDEGLNEKLKEILINQSVFDFGCGDGSYIKELEKIGCKVNGCDGNPHTPELTNGLGFVADLSIPHNLNLYDWVISFEVGEHIPEKYEDIFIDNLCHHAKKGIIMSWAYPGQPGEGHINCKSSEHIIMQMYKRNFLVDYFATNELRETAKTWWFQSNLLLLYKIQK